VSLNTSVEVAFETSWLLSPAAGAMVTLLWNYNLVCLEPRSRSYDCFSQKLQIAFQGILNRSFAVFFKLTLPWLHGRHNTIISPLCCLAAQRAKVRVLFLSLAFSQWHCHNVKTTFKCCLPEFRLCEVSISGRRWWLAWGRWQPVRWSARRRWQNSRSCVGLFWEIKLQSTGRAITNLNLLPLFEQRGAFYIDFKINPFII